MSLHPLRIETPGEKTMPTPAQKTEAVRWFTELRDRFCAAFEEIEREYQETKNTPSVVREADKAERTEQMVFKQKVWKRNTAAEDQSARAVVREADEAERTERMAQTKDGGGGTMALLRGKIFEKAGVNVSEVYGEFSKEFRGQIPGASNDGKFWAAGISMVVHPAHPRVPALHMNTRHVITSHGWFGGGGDLNPVFPDAQDTADFHAALKAACDAFAPDYYPRYKQWADEYFFIPHRARARGVGGIFYDNHDSGDWAADFAFTRAVGEAVLNIYPQLVRRHMNKPFTAEEREQQLIWRGHYAEFNLVYDRGTKFGLATGGNTEAILMSLPPEVKWP